MNALSTAVIVAASFAVIAAAKPAAPAFTIASADFSSGGTMPTADAYDKGGCPGKNISPELHWTGAPAGTKSFALTVFDPDAHGGWWHWVVYGIDPETADLAQAEPFPGLEGKTSFGTSGYGGPCPPVGDAPHHYIFTLYALDAAVGGSLTGPQLLKAIDGHVLGKASVVGRFGR
jgi:Raf kinase inhibitor-like YbhB/YbcL family protein